MYGLTTVVLFVQLACAQICYYPDGEEAPTAKPCGGPTKACCWDADDEHDACYSNGYCYSFKIGAIYRGACTDAAWSSGSGCPLDCPNTGTEGGEWLSLCSNGTLCCGSVQNATECCNSNAGFGWGNATITNFDLVPPSALKSATSRPQNSVAGNATLATSQSDTGAIAGGTLGGVVVGVLLGAAISYIVTKRINQRSRQAANTYLQPIAPNTIDYVSTMHVLQSPSSLTYSQELDANRAIHELPR